MIEIQKTQFSHFNIKVGWTDLLNAKIYEDVWVLKIESKRKGFSFYFDSFSEAEEFVLKNFVSLEALIRSLTLKTLSELLALK